MNFTKKELDLLERLCVEYIQAKELVSKAEEIDQRSGANIQINKEFRDALSHVIRVFGDILSTGEQKASASSYYEKNIDKAIGHIYRAGYDAMDGVAISLRENINILNSFSASAKTQVIPNYAEKIGTLNSFHKKLKKYKEDKDIGQGSFDTFHACIKEMELIEKSISELYEAIPVIKDIEIERKKEKRFSFKQTIVISIIFLILGSVIGFVLNLLFG